MEPDSKKEVLKLKELEHIRKEYLSSIIHKLRTPLTPIREYILRILKGKTGEINAQQKRYLDIVFSQIERLIDVIEGLSFDLRQLSAGRVKLKKEPLSIKRLLEETLKEKEIRNSILKNKIDIDIQCFSSWDIIFFDRDVMLKILKETILEIISSVENEKISFIINKKDSSSEINLEITYPLKININKIMINLIKKLIEIQEGGIKESINEKFKYLIFKFPAEN